MAPKNLLKHNQNLIISTIFCHPVKLKSKQKTVSSGVYIEYMLLLNNDEGEKDPS